MIAFRAVSFVSLLPGSTYDLTEASVVEALAPQHAALDQAVRDRREAIRLVRSLKRQDEVLAALRQWDHKGCYDRLSPFLG